jgi:hypothetical protein
MAAAASANPCGDAKETITPFDPNFGWFHESVDYSVDGLINAASITGWWWNFSTGGANHYNWTWGPSGDSVSGEHSVYSQRGSLAAQITGSSSIFSFIEDAPWGCSIASSQYKWYEL